MAKVPSHGHLGKEVTHGDIFCSSQEAEQESKECTAGEVKRGARAQQASGQANLVSAGLSRECDLPDSFQGGC